VSYIEKKWQSNQEKVAFANAFPGLKSDWEPLLGRKLLAAVEFKAHSEGVVLVFEEGAFTIASRPPETPQSQIAALEAARSEIEAFHAESYRKLDELSQRDREMTRLARMERILDAVKNNMEEIPELQSALREIVAQTEESL
jgi:hypothetical protein